MASSFRLGLYREQMKGSVMDAMAGAVDEAAAMLFCVSLAYKESGAQNPQKPHKPQKCQKCQKRS